MNQDVGDKLGVDDGDVGEDLEDDLEECVGGAGGSDGVRDQSG